MILSDREIRTALARSHQDAACGLAPSLATPQAASHRGIADVDEWAMAVKPAVNKIIPRSIRKRGRLCSVQLSGVNSMFSRFPSRRMFLRSAGVALALPLLEWSRWGGAAPAPAAPPRRMVAMNFALGLHGPNLFPRRGRPGLRHDALPGSARPQLRDQLTVDQRPVASRGDARPCQRQFVSDRGPSPRCAHVSQ